MRVAERAAVAMVSPGLEGYYGSGGGGVICRGRRGPFKMPFSLAQQPLAPSLRGAHSLSDSLSSFSF